MHRFLAFVGAITLGVTSVSQASLNPMVYEFYPTGSQVPIGTLAIDYAPVEYTAGWVLPYTSNLDPNIVSFSFDFTSVGGPIVGIAQFNNLFPVPGDPLVSLNGLEIDSGVLIGDSNFDQGQWGMSDIPGLDQARWISNAGSTPSIYGDWHALPEPSTLALLAMGGIAILRRRR
jgi:hypothetical protein